MDEKGVKAGQSRFSFISLSNDLHSLLIAATSIVRILLATSTPPRKVIHFLCNKPFVYAIRYKQTTLFMGRYVKVIDTNNLPPVIDGGRR